VNPVFLLFRRHPLVVVFMHYPWCVKWAKRPNAINVQSEFNQAHHHPQKSSDRTLTLSPDTTNRSPQATPILESNSVTWTSGKTNTSPSGMGSSASGNWRRISEHFERESHGVSCLTNRTERRERKSVCVCVRATESRRSYLPPSPSSPTFSGPTTERRSSLLSADGLTFSKAPLSPYSIPKRR